MTIPRRSDSHMAIADLPDAVGPQITGMRSTVAAMSTSSESALELIPRKLHDGGPTVDVVRRQFTVAERGEQRPHFLRRERVAGFDRRLACNGRGELLMARSPGRRAVAGERRQGVAETTLGVEAWMRHWYRVNDHGLSSELTELIPETLQQLAVRIERFGFVGRQLKRERKQQSLRWAGSALERGHELLVEDALVCRVLVDENDARVDLEHQVGATKLDERRDVFAGSCVVSQRTWYVVRQRT